VRIFKCSVRKPVKSTESLDNYTTGPTLLPRIPGLRRVRNRYAKRFRDSVQKQLSDFDRCTSDIEQEKERIRPKSAQAQFINAVPGCASYFEEYVYVAGEWRPKWIPSYRPWCGSDEMGWHDPTRWCTLTGYCYTDYGITGQYGLAGSRLIVTEELGARGETSE